MTGRGKIFAAIVLLLAAAGCVGKSMIAGQEDMIEDVAITIAKERGLYKDAASVGK